ncbi:MAG: hypothetical protein ACOH2N_18225 [Devosia sp.]
MTIQYQNHPFPSLNSKLAVTLRRLASWIEAPSARQPEKARGLPRELAEAEDWLLNDLGLVEPDDGKRPRSAHKER